MDDSPALDDGSETRHVLRHALATLACGAAKTVRGTPAASVEGRTGRLAMRRRPSGRRMKGENGSMAKGRTGLDQTPPDARVEFD